MAPQQGYCLYPTAFDKNQEFPIPVTMIPGSHPSAAKDFQKANSPSNTCLSPVYPISASNAAVTSAWDIHPEGANLGMEESITFTHNLNSRDLFVYIYYRASDPFPPIPGEETWTHNYVSEEEVYWIAGNLNEIVVYFNTDLSNYWLQEMRVLIYKIPN